jgi:putative flippase GtrA
MRHVIRRDARRALQFAAVGLVGVGINNSVLWLLVERAHVYLPAASLLATETAIVSNFAMNQVWTLADIRSPHSLLRRLVRFNAVALGGLVLTAAGLLVLAEAAHFPYLLANVVAIACGAAWNYLANRCWTWPVASVRSAGAPLLGPQSWLARLRPVLWLRLLLCAVVAMALVRLVPLVGLVGVMLLAVSMLIFGQSVFSLYLMLYAWEDPQRLTRSSPSGVFLPPSLSFSVLLPARSEQAVIFETIRSVIKANYPRELLEAVVICHADDIATIAEAERAVQELRAHNVRVETFSTGPINKPRALNVGLASTSKAVVTVFDAEDDIDPNVFNLVNTIMLRERTGIVQSGVQLMNYLDHWFAAHNVLEYFFWFKSRLHYHASKGMIPLGGTRTVSPKMPISASDSAPWASPFESSMTRAMSRARRRRAASARCSANAPGGTRVFCKSCGNEPGSSYPPSASGFWRSTPWRIPCCTAC